MSEDYHRGRMGAKPMLGYETREYREGRESLNRDAAAGGEALGEIIIGLFRLMMSRIFLMFSLLLSGAIIGFFVAQTAGPISGTFLGFGLTILFALFIFHAQAGSLKIVIGMTIGLAMISIGILTAGKTADKSLSMLMYDFRLIKNFFVGETEDPLPPYTHVVANDGNSLILQSKTINGKKVGTIPDGGCVRVSTDFGTGWATAVVGDESNRKYRFINTNKIRPLEPGDRCP